MTTTYTGTLDSLLEKVRFEFGDKAIPFKFTDEEILYVIAEEHDSVFNSTARLCEIYATLCSDAASRTMGPLRIELKDRVKSYLDRAKELRAKAYQLAKPYAGGIYVSDEDTFEADTSLKQPTFSNNLMDNE
jgi:hypothetical protein